MGFNGKMYPTNLAAKHPAANHLKQYGSAGCPVNTGKQWSKKELQARMERGPHVYALKPEAMAAFKTEVIKKVKKGQVNIYFIPNCIKSMLLIFDQNCTLS